MEFGTRQTHRPRLRGQEQRSPICQFADVLPTCQSASVANKLDCCWTQSVSGFIPKEFSAVYLGSDKRDLTESSEQFSGVVALIVRNVMENTKGIDTPASLTGRMAYRCLLVAEGQCRNNIGAVQLVKEQHKYATCIQTILAPARIQQMLGVFEFTRLSVAYCLSFQATEPGKMFRRAEVPNIGRVCINPDRVHDRFIEKVQL